jgi:hypothetical protein
MKQPKTDLGISQLADEIKLRHEQLYQELLSYKSLLKIIADMEWDEEQFGKIKEIINKQLSEKK